MNKVLIIEESTNEKASGFDHIFSFRSNFAHSFPEEYITQDKVDSIYDETYEAVCDYLKKNLLKNTFSYLGVDLLWCFKKALFEYAYLARVRYETFVQLRAKRSSNQFYLWTKEQGLNAPNLAEIIGASPLSQQPDIHMMDGASSRRDKHAALKTNGRAIAFPDVLTLGNVSKNKVALFYDFEKSQDILKRLKPFGCTLFSNSEPRRMFLRALLHMVPLYQLTYHSRQDLHYRQKAELFRKLLAGHTLFADFSLGDMAWEKLLGWKLDQLFQSTLPQLLFAIEQIHQFFSNAHALKSVLLDEDISPSKTAFCQIACQYHVNTFVECHGLIGGKHGFVPPNADKIFVWGRSQKDKLIRWGCAEEKIIVSGYSRYGRYQKLDPEATKREIAKKFGLDPSRKIALLAFPPITHSWFLIFEHKMRRFILNTLDTISELLEESDKIQFVLKVHPADQDKLFYQRWANQNRFSRRLVVVEQYDPLRLARGVDFLIVYGSTYAVDGFAMDKPVVLLHDDSWFFEEFRKYSIFTYANNREELKQAILQQADDRGGTSKRWAEARRECLNENGMEPADLIVSHLLNENVPVNQISQTAAKVS